jgi:hypothetical protein
MTGGKAFSADSVKNGLQHVDFKIVFVEEMPLYFIQEITVRMDEAAADFAFQMEMFPAVCAVVYVLIAGALAVTEGVLTDLPPGGQFFKMPVDGGLSDKLFRLRKVA